VFYNTGAGAGTTLIIRVPATPPGAVSAYKTAWAVVPETAANGNISKYGADHKRIVITDAP
jgi:hypothetical protein